MLAGLIPQEAVEADPDLGLIAGRYAEFRLCREMGWTITELQAQPADRVQEFFLFLAAENDARSRLNKAPE